MIGTARSGFHPKCSPIYHACDASGKLYSRHQGLPLSAWHTRTLAQRARDVPNHVDFIVFVMRHTSNFFNLNPSFWPCRKDFRCAINIRRTTSRLCQRRCRWNFDHNWRDLWYVHLSSSGSDPHSKTLMPFCRERVFQVHILKTCNYSASAGRDCDWDVGSMFVGKSFWRLQSCTAALSGYVWCRILKSRHGKDAKSHAHSVRSKRRSRNIPHLIDFLQQKLKVYTQNFTGNFLVKKYFGLVVIFAS